MAIAISSVSVPGLFNPEMVNDIIPFMSEYIEIEIEINDDGTILIQTNLSLTAGEDAEQYESALELEMGSPVAQSLAGVEGITSLRMDGSEMALTCRPDADQHVIIADVSAALKEFFL
jgi:hypothetical protein